MCNVDRMKANRVVAAQTLSVRIGWVSADFRLFGKCKEGAEKLVRHRSSTRKILLHADWDADFRVVRTMC